MLLENFKSFIKTAKLFNPADRILLAVSGGMDSVVMAELFHQAGFSFGMAHCNFQLRGNESDGDEKFVGELAERYEAPFFRECFPTAGYAKSEGISTQMAARKLRYGWLEKIRARENFDYIAIGTHQNDDLETFLINFIRGTGISGLSGIQPKNGKVIRPLLFTNREQISIFAKEQAVLFREDRSNASEKYIRNKIRHSIIPIMKEINPAMEKTALETIQRLKETEVIFRQQMDALRDKVLTSTGEAIIIDLQQLRKFPALPTCLFELLRPYHFNESIVRDLTEAMKNQPGKKFFSSTHSLYYDRDQIFILPLDKQELTEEAQILANQSIIRQPISIKCSLVKKEAFPLKTGENYACLDSDTLEFPLNIRKWKAGDYFYPLGMTQRKKLSDFFIDNKVPLYKKENTFVLTTKENKIVWVIGHRIDDRFKVKDSTKSVYCLETDELW